eukprot:CAMPEP_0117674624 /NCGR_PEP_ID=MMETSP0804-20121206/15141_1 /TAXON_ID=1074897 /ORGANISM="Tetraselmis astigmatica, Strain CCMP880" /LENGTH=34 /DNA_ID= /DNA_START= /DNA_END= /DNA_ORIENTATION=
MTQLALATRAAPGPWWRSGQILRLLTGKGPHLSI